MTKLELLRRRWLLVALAAVLVLVVAVWILAGSLVGAGVTALLVLAGFVAVPALLLRGAWRVLGGLGGLLAFVMVALLVIKLVYGGGDPYPDLRTPPRVPEAALETLVTLPYPPGNVAVSAGGRIFFNYHPFALAHRFGPTVFELVDGQPRPFPDAAFQARYQGVFGMTVDRRERLWFTEPASLDHDRTRVLAFDLRTGELVFEHWFPPGVATFAQDLRVAPDGETVYLADTGLFRFSEGSLFVLDVASRTHRRVLASHPSTQPQDWVIRTRLGEHKLAYGLITFAVGVDGLELGADGAWLYYASMSHDTLFKVPTAALRDPALPAGELARQVVAVGRKPLSDGITVDRDGSVLITDIEHGGIARVREGGTLETLVTSPRVLWADGVVVGPTGDVIFTDSAIPAYVDQLARPPARDRLEAAGPYHVFRLRAPSAAALAP